MGPDIKGIKGKTGGPKGSKRGVGGYGRERIGPRGCPGPIG